MTEAGRPGRAAGKPPKSRARRADCVGVVYDNRGKAGYVRRRCSAGCGAPVPTTRVNNPPGSPPGVSRTEERDAQGEAH